MTGDDFALMSGVLAVFFLLASLLAWRGGDSRDDIGLLGGSGLTLGAVSAALFAI